MRRLLKILAVSGGALVALAALGVALVATYAPFAKWLLGIETISAGVSPFPPAATQFDHAPLDALLVEHLRDGRVDYAALAADDLPLRRYMASLEVSGPDTSPARLPTEAHRTAWTINAYNAAVLLGVVTHWPIGSVRDVRGVIQPRSGFAFFWGQRFLLDGELTNLYDLETGLRLRTRDARIHGALNCASVGCPALRPTAWRAEGLDEALDEAARRLASEPLHVQVDDAARAIVLSRIYHWYAEDFQNDARARGLGGEVLDWVEHFADADVAAAVARARAAKYAVTFRAYDWSLNGM